MADISAFEGEEHREFEFKAENSSYQQAAILVHGFPGTPREMRPLGHILVSLGVDSYGILLPGFGTDIANLSKQTSQDWIDYLKLLYDRLSKTYRSIIFVGYSFGGGLLINFLNMNSIQPTKIILISPFWDIFAQFNRLITFLGNLFWPLLRRFGPELKPFRGSDFSDPVTRKEMKKLFPGSNLDDQDIQTTIRELSIPISVIDQLRKIGREAINNSGKIRQEILIIQGEEDQVVPLDHTLKLHSKLPGSNIRVVQGGDHEMILDGSKYLREIRMYIEDFVIQSIDQSELTG